MQQEVEKKRVPIMTGWHQMDAPGLLIGNKCKECGEFFFPKARSCRNPKCRSNDLEEHLFSTRGEVWSFSTNYYKGPAPYKAPEPFVPYTIVVATLKEEKIMVAGQLAKDCDPAKLKMGTEVELFLDTLYEDADGTEHIIWKWKLVE
jgi:uncharacterized OB-fold protein